MSRDHEEGATQTRQFDGGLVHSPPKNCYPAAMVYDSLSYTIAQQQRHHTTLLCRSTLL